MSAFNDYLNASRKAFETWRPRVQQALEQRGLVIPPGAEGEDASTEDTPAGDAACEDDSLQSERGPWPPTLGALLGQSGVMPPYSLFLGACEDGLPFHLDLSNPAPGALLIAGDPGCGKSHLLLAALESATRLNSAERVQLSVIARQPDDYMGLAEKEHCQEIFPVDHSAVRELITELAALAEARRHSRVHDPTILLAIDGLAELVEHLDENAFLRLYWLARHGPRSRVWTLATLDSQDCDALDPRFLAAFRTRLVGGVQDGELAACLGGGDGFDTSGLEHGQFCAPFGEEALVFWACEMEDVQQ